MKKIPFLLLALAVVAMCTTGCVSSKKIIYFQGSDTMFAHAQKILQHYEMRLKPADQVVIKVTSSEPDLLKSFSQGVILGSSSSNTGNIGGSNSMGNLYSYTVSSEGDITLPIMGKVHVADLTTEEVSALVAEKLISGGYVNDPEVTTKLLNARVTVLGAAGHVSVINLTSERNTISDILAQCGDIDDTGFKHKVRLYREQNGERVMYILDLTKADIFRSPAYYVQQNDLIYVEPNRTKNIKASPMYTYMSAGSSIIGAVMTVISLIFLIKGWN